MTGISRQGPPGGPCIRGKRGSKASARGSGPHHVAGSRTAIAFLPIHPPWEAARLQGLRTPWAVVGASSLAALPLVTTRARSCGQRRRLLNRRAARPQSHEPAASAGRVSRPGARRRYGESAAAGRSGPPRWLSRPSRVVAEAGAAVSLELAMQVRITSNHYPVRPTGYL